MLVVAAAGAALACLAWAASQFGLGAAVGADTPLANLVEALLVTVVHGIVLAVLVGLALGQDHTIAEPDADLLAELPIYVAVFRLPIALLKRVLGFAGPEVQRLTLLVRAPMLALSVGLLLLPSLLQVAHPGALGAIVGALASTALLLCIASTLRGTDSGWGFTGIAQLAQSYAVAFAVVVAASVFGNLVLFGLVGGTAIGNVAAWTIGALLNTWLVTALAEVTSGTTDAGQGPRTGLALRTPIAAEGNDAVAPVTQLHPAAPTPMAAAADYAPVAEVAPASTLAGELRGAATAPAPFGAWIECVAAGTLTIGVGWNDAYPARVQLANREGEWLELEPLASPDYRHLTMPAGWVWLQFPCPDEMPARELVVSWNLAPAQAVHAAAA
jgi:hypothetical protein